MKGSLNQNEYACKGFSFGLVTIFSDGGIIRGIGDVSCQKITKFVR